MKKLFSIALVILLRTAVTNAQDPSLPDGRVSAHFVYHPSSRAMLLIDGYQHHLDSPRNDVWAWDGKKWRQIVASGPGTRSLSAGALNGKTGQFEIFAGIGSKNYDSKRDDTWAFDGTQWMPRITNRIGTRDHHEMVYADHLKAFVVYGGTDASRANDTLTWLRVDKEYTPLAIPGPGARHHFGMAYDSKRKQVVLYGGGKEQQQAELWEFDGNQWSRRQQPVSPGPRVWNSLVYDEQNELTLLHGGNDTTRTTWGWNGHQWKKVAENGPAGLLIAMGYDPRNKVIWAYGGAGRDNTVVSALWELKNGTWRKVSDNGDWRWKDGKLMRETN